MTDELTQPDDGDIVKILKGHPEFNEWVFGEPSYTDLLDALHNIPMPLYTAHKLIDAVSEACDTDPYLVITMKNGTIHEGHGAFISPHSHTRFFLTHTTGGDCVHIDFPPIEVNDVLHAMIVPS